MHELKMIGIYKILNVINSKIYIGSSYKLAFRLGQHKFLLNKNIHRNPYLQSAWNKYWEQSFIFKIIELTSREALLIREQYWMDFYKSYNKEFGYNISPTAGNNTGYKHSESSKLKRSIALTGLKRSPEICRKMSLIKLNQSEETKRKIGLAHKGKKVSKETKRKLSELNKGKPSPMAGKKHSIETRLKMSKDRKGTNLGKKRGPYKKKGDINE